MEKDIKLINKEFDVIRDDSGFDIDDDGREFEYYAIAIKGDLKKEFDSLISKLDKLVFEDCKLEYFEDYDFNLDRGYYFGDLAGDGEIEIRFAKCLEE